MRSNKKLLSFLPLCCLLLMAALHAAETPTADEVDERREMVVEADRILMLGDSITWAGSYVTDIDLWLRTQDWVGEMPLVINTGLSSETVSGLTEEGHAGGKFPRPDLATRIDSVLATTKPDLVFACYGMNCGIYKPLDEQRFASYKAGIRMVQAKVNAAGAKLILVTPPYFDDQVAKKDFSYNAVLDAYSDWLVTLREEGQPVIDLHDSMQAEVESRRKSDPQFTFQKDSIHPDSAGHWAMAQPIIRWFGDEESANAESPAAMLIEVENADKVVGLAHQRMSVLRNAYLTAAGHDRPGVPEGKAVEDAEKEAEKLNEQLNAALKQ
ncbi:hypothetical protein Pla110_19590 [Polystyrenella longa]|uniref:SGNH hydrolase-type esterase domain-containing protein n=1 Tax=Polystyrenella longa TaxID=2528007 RepID=A0A518CLY6_9PLAN|nr:SGNH/GDSL hydrolase family protein [Polystyrenella longa]QDU80235.1 hypothetical protein Pla110_19590 [Polystyrenella longa]